MLWKPRGTHATLSGAHARELGLAAEVEALVDDELGRGGLIEELVHELRHRATAHPHDAAWHFLLGRLLMVAEDPVEARDELERAAVLDPRDPRIPAHLGVWYEAALLAACGDHAVVELPLTAGPAVCVDSARFAHNDQWLPPRALAARVEELLAQAMRFRLSRADVAHLRAHVSRVRAVVETHEPPDEPAHTAAGALSSP